jgi:chorismate mutase
MSEQTTSGEAADGAAGGWRTEGDPLRLFALRGATTVTEDSEAAILEATSELVQVVLSRNELQHDAIVSCIFTCTPDLTAQFPALAARRLGLDRVPLLCAQEIGVEGALPMTIRLLLHYYAPAGHKSAHVYLREATALRTDLSAAQ